jgi:hypothetical protein
MYLYVAALAFIFAINSIEMHHTIRLRSRARAATSFPSFDEREAP